MIEERRNEEGRSLLDSNEDTLYPFPAGRPVYANLRSFNRAILFFAHKGNTGHGLYTRHTYSNGDSRHVVLTAKLRLGRGAAGLGCSEAKFRGS